MYAEPTEFGQRYLKKNVILAEIYKMLDFDKYVARHGEHGVQAIIERLERYEGIRASISTSLEDRWNLLMKANLSEQRIAA